MENSLFTPFLDELFNLWNNAVCQINYWVCPAGRYISTSILERVHQAFFNYYQFHAMTYMADEIILARMMTAIDFKFERGLHCHDEGYESDNGYGLSAQITSLSMYTLYFKAKRLKTAWLMNYIMWSNWTNQVIQNKQWSCDSTGYTKLTNRRLCNYAHCCLPVWDYKITSYT